MKTWMENLWRSLGGRGREREIDEELRFHLDLLTQDLINADMSYSQADRVARAQFGNIEQVRNQCIAIRRRISPFNRALKVLLTIVVVCGLLIRVAGPDYRVARIGGILIFIGLAGRLFLYLRGLAASTPIRTDLLSALVLNEPTFRDNRQDLTPLERVFKQ